jgi:hypothetical protein
VVNEWLLDYPDEGMPACSWNYCNTASTVFCTQYAKKDGSSRFVVNVHAAVLAALRNRIRVL